MEYDEIEPYIFEVKGRTGIYRTDLINHICLCPSWIFGDKFSREGYRTCKHLERLKKIKEAKYDQKGELIIGETIKIC